MFAGGFELDAAQAVCAGDGLDDADIPELVGSLVDKSVIKRRQGDGGDRLRLLEPLRQFGRERLREAGDEHRLRSRHADWVGELAQRSRPRMPIRSSCSGGSGTSAANIWAAIDFCLADPADAERGATICSDLWVYWVAQGPVSDMRRVFAALLPSVPAAGSRRAARALCTARGSSRSSRTTTPFARQTFDEAVAIGRATRDADLVARSLAFLSSVSWVESRPADAAGVRRRVRSPSRGRCTCAARRSVR